MCAAIFNVHHLHLYNRPVCPLTDRKEFLCRFPMGEKAVDRDKMSPGGPHADTSQLRAYLAFKPPLLTKTCQPHPANIYWQEDREKGLADGLQPADSSGPVAEPWGSF